MRKRLERGGFLGGSSFQPAEHGRRAGPDQQRILARLCFDPVPQFLDCFQAASELPAEVPRVIVFGSEQDSERPPRDVRLVLEPRDPVGQLGVGIQCQRGTTEAVQDVRVHQKCGAPHFC